MLTRYKNTFYKWLADRLPKKLVYFTTIRLLIFATTGEYSNTNTESIRAITTLRRWKKTNGYKKENS